MAHMRPYTLTAYSTGRSAREAELLRRVQIENQKLQEKIERLNKQAKMVDDENAKLLEEKTLLSKRVQRYEYKLPLLWHVSVTISSEDSEDQLSLKLKGL